MNILDENILKNQRELLLGWRVKIRQIGYDVGQSGMQDEEIIYLLLKLKYPTFFTLDSDFYNYNLCHTRYCLLYMDIKQNETAIYIRHLLRHREFNTQLKRMGKIIRLSTTGISVRKIHREKEIDLSWGQD